MAEELFGDSSNISLGFVGPWLSCLAKVALAWSGDRAGPAGKVFLGRLGCSLSLYLCNASTDHSSNRLECIKVLSLDMTRQLIRP